MTKYTFYVDETGDAGLEKVRQSTHSKGASPYLVLGGCLVPSVRKAELLNLLSDVRSEIDKSDLHCTKLSHFQMAKYARMVGASARFKSFALVSSKSTVGNYKEVIAGKGSDQKYYNKCVSYLLERLGHCMLTYNISENEVRIVFEERKSHDYEKLRNYIHQIKRTPRDKRLEYYLSVIDPRRMEAQAKGVDDLMTLADQVAFSVSAAINASSSNYGVPEQRYLRELKSCFFSDSTGEAVGKFGLKLFKRHSMKFDDTTKTFLDSWHVKGVEPDLHLSK